MVSPLLLHSTALGESCLQRPQGCWGESCCSFVGNALLNMSAMEETKINVIQVINLFSQGNLLGTENGLVVKLCSIRDQNFRVLCLMLQIKALKWGITGKVLEDALACYFFKTSAIGLVPWYCRLYLHLWCRHLLWVPVHVPPLPPLALVWLLAWFYILSADLDSVLCSREFGMLKAMLAA